MTNFKNDKISLQREKIIKLLRSTKRKGIETLIRFMDESNYFNCWGSFRHHKYNGGLAEHSLEVYDAALSNNSNCDKNSIIIASILHDLCKVQYDFPKETGDYFTKGHGTKSVRIIEDYIGLKLTDEERRAIRFHMGCKSKIKDEEELKEYTKARDEELWELIHSGDCISCGNYPKTLHSVVRNVISFLGL